MDSLKQFIPDNVCLDCKGCCRYQEAESVWQPKIGREEVQTALKSGLAYEVMSQAKGSDNRIKTRLCNGEHDCTFLNEDDHTCQIYEARPFECQLYPFLLTRHGSDTEVAAHLACPYVQDKLGSVEFAGYVEYLKEYFKKKDTLDFIERNPGHVTDYSEYKEELEPLFTVPFDTGRSPATRKLLERKNDLKQLGRTHLSSHSFVNVFAWRYYFNFDLKMIDGRLCVFAEDKAGGVFLYFPPAGQELSASVIDQCFGYMVQRNNGHPVSRIENVSTDLLEFFPEERYRIVPKTYEYLYYRKDVVRYTGNRYKSKRSAYNQFVKGYTYEVKPYSEEYFEPCMDLYEEWRRDRLAKNDNDIFIHMLEENESVHGIVLRFFKELDMVGRVVFVDGAVKGYTVGYPLNKDVFCVLFEITDLKVKGLSAFIFSAMCSDPAVEAYRFINVMDDYEAPGLQKTKRSFHPAVLIPSYTVSLRETE